MTGTYADLDRLSWVRLRDLLASNPRSVAIIPTGSVEAHGPHLPLGTDRFISEAVAERAGRALAARGFLAVRFPALPYGVTDWARGFSGTTSISADVTESVLLQVAKEALAMGFRRIAMTNAHLEPGHIAALRRVTKAFEADTGVPLLFVDKTRRALAQRLTPEFRSGSCHAGRYETSLVLAIAPELVDRARAEKLPEHTVPLHEKIAAGAQGFADCGLDDAYCGNPAAASADEGERSLQILSEMVVEAVEASAATDSSANKP